VKWLGEVLARGAAGFGTAGRASLVMNLVLLLSMLFAGFLVNTASIAPALQWIHYLSVFFYGFESLTTNEISGTQFTFTVSPVINQDARISLFNSCQRECKSLI
jgi:ABC-type multidrug transport system permease subunit